MAEIEHLIASIPDKRRYCIAEIVGPISTLLEISPMAARMRIYRGICEGKIKARKHLGSLRIPRSEVIRILHGEDPYESV